MAAEDDGRLPVPLANEDQARGGRRWVIVTLIVGALFVGAMINVLVAWALAAYSPVSYRQVRVDHELRLEGVDESVPCATSQSRSTGFDARMHYGISPLVAGSGIVVSRVVTGWPYPALEGERLDVIHKSSIPYVGVRFAAWPDGGTAKHAFSIAPDQRSRVNSLRLLPLSPLPLGFALNTLVYAFPFLAPLLFLAIRHVARPWFGRCAGCGYPIGSSAICTECGRAVRVRRPASVR